MGERAIRPWTWAAFKWAVTLAKADFAEDRGDFDRAWSLLNEAEQMGRLRVQDRVQRARLLLRMQRLNEANKAFLVLRDELKGSEHPDRKYLRHYCTYMLSSMSRASSGQWAYEAEQAKQLPCSASLKRNFPMTTIDEIHERIPPKP